MTASAAAAPAPVSRSTGLPASAFAARCRTTALRTPPARVDREAKVIHGAALVTRGEALGHGLWLDAAFLDQVLAAGNDSARARGVKARFTHPGLCADGLGSFLGRWRTFSRDGQTIRADLHLAPTAFTSPRGDLGAYVLDLAEDDPASFGNSIVMELDVGAMDRFWAEYEDPEGNFKSPDPDNAGNLPHARLARLWAADVVDDPAANPNGFFGRGDELPARAESALAFLLDVIPAGVAQAPSPAHLPDPELFGGLEPARVKTFFRDFLARHGLTLTPRPAAVEVPTGVTVNSEKERSMEPKKEPEPAPAAPPVPSDRDRFAALKAAFPKDLAFAVEAFEKGESVTDAKARYSDRQTEVLAKLAGEKAQLEADLAQARKAPALGVPPAGSAAGGASAEPDFDALVEAAQKEDKCSRGQAIAACARKHSKLHQEWLRK